MHSIFAHRHLQCGRDRHGNNDKEGRRVLRKGVSISGYDYSFQSTWCNGTGFISNVDYFK